MLSLYFFARLKSLNITLRIDNVLDPTIVIAYDSKKTVRILRFSFKFCAWLKVLRQRRPNKVWNTISGF